MRLRLRRRLRRACSEPAQSLRGWRIVGITAPTLIVHAQDDTLQPYDHATFAATHIAGSALLSYERGGHFVLLTEQEEVSRAVLTHVRDHATSRLGDSAAANAPRQAPISHLHRS